MIGPTLYNRDTTGKIRVWWMEQEGDKHRTHSGVQGGQVTVSGWTVAKGKNEGKKNATTGDEQAAKEIQARYKKQLKSGYFESIHDIDSFLYVQPMLAKLYTDFCNRADFWDTSWGIQTKLNGHRCVITQDGMRTRTGEKYHSCPHIMQQLDPFFSKYPDAVLDGELFNMDLREKLNEFSKLVRKTVDVTKEDLAKSEEHITYYIYDGYGFDGYDQSVVYQERHSWMLSHLPTTTKTDILVYHPVSNPEDINSHYARLLEQRHEGAILRNLSGAYENKRSKNLLKVKPEDDAEFKILAVHEGNGNWAGTGKTITLEMGDRTFDATFKGSMEQGKEFLKNKEEWIGKIVTIKYNGLTGLGVPNFAQFDWNNQGL